MGAAGKRMTPARHCVAATTTTAVTPATAAMASAAAAMASTTTAAATVAATTTTAAMLRQCRPSACQDQSQRTYRQKNAFALDNHMPLLPSPACGRFTQDMIYKTLSTQRGSRRLVYITPA
jgi:hypothetical protein